MKKKMLLFLMFMLCLSNTSNKGSVCWGEEFEGKFDESNYYGADLIQFPPKIRKWIIDVAFPKSKMEQEHMKDSKLKAWWSEDGNSVFLEASYIIANGYVNKEEIVTWGHGTR